MENKDKKKIADELIKKLGIKKKIDLSFLRRRDLLKLLREAENEEIQGI